MGTAYAAQGSVVTATQGAGKRIAISSVANTTPVTLTVSAGHGCYQTDTIFVEGTGLAIDGATYQVNVVNSSEIQLLGTTASGTSSTGYFIDYQLLPAGVLPSGGDLVDPNAMAASLEWAGNPAPFLYARTGKWRLYNQYILEAGSDSTPIVSNPWSSVSSFSSSSFVALPNASVTLQSMSDNTGFAPIFQAGDLVQFSITSTVYGNVGAGTAFAYVNVGCTVASGGVISSGSGVDMLGEPFGTIYLAGASLSNAVPIPLTLSGSFVFGSVDAPFNDVALTMAARVDAITGASSCLLELIGSWTGYINQYRAN